MKASQTVPGESLAEQRHRAFGLENALQGTVFAVTRSSMLVAVSYVEAQGLEVAGPDARWRIDKHNPETTLKRQQQVRTRRAAVMVFPANNLCHFFVVFCMSLGTQRDHTNWAALEAPVQGHCQSTQYA